jgi:hypothetical protein
MATPFKVVVYINGYRFDPIHVTATFAAGDVCSFQVDVPPVPEWDLLLPRSHGAVFFLDANTGTYRLMCEGEYVGLSRSRNGTGQRTRSLVFRGLHGFMEGTSFFNVFGQSNAAGSSPSPDQAVNALSAIANGSLIVQKKESAGFKPVSMADILIGEHLGRTHRDPAPARRADPNRELLLLGPSHGPEDVDLHRYRSEGRDGFPAVEGLPGQSGQHARPRGERTVHDGSPEV